jgi:hypothetical protein
VTTGKELLAHPADEVTLGELEPKERLFVIAFSTPGTETYGNAAKAARFAGYGNSESTPDTFARIGNRLLHRARVAKGIAELGMRALTPDALAAIRQIVRDPLHKDRMKAASAILERQAPTIQKSEIDVTHRIVDHTAEALQVLSYMKSIGASREMLEAHFGFTGLARYEEMLAKQAKPVVLDAKFEEVKKPLAFDLERDRKESEGRK